MVLNDQSKMPFGRYREEQLKDVPADYLIWFYHSSWGKKKYPALFSYVEKGYKVLMEEVREARGGKYERLIRVMSMLCADFMRPEPMWITNPSFC